MFRMSKPFILTGRKDGYTLVELAVVMTVMVILFMIGFANYRAYRREKVVDLVVGNVTADLNLTRNKALTGDKPSGFCTSPNTLTSYRFYRNTNTNYIVRAMCSNGTHRDVKSVNFSAVGGTGVQMVTRMSNNCSTSWFVGSTYVDFYVLGQGTSISPSAACFRIQLNMAGANSKFIYVNASGTIR